MKCLPAFIRLCQSAATQVRPKPFSVASSTWASAFAAKAKRICEPASSSMKLVMGTPSPRAEGSPATGTEYTRPLLASA